MFFKVITIIAVTVAVFILAAQIPYSKGGNDGTIAIPLTKRSDTSEAREFQVTSHTNGNIIHGPSDMDGFERHTGTPHPFAMKRNGLGPRAFDVAKYMYGVWYGTIYIGTPPKSFTVQLNTGISDLIVPATTGDENCISHSGLWYPTSYHFANLDLDMGFSAVFADGRSVSGKQYLDNVTIAGFTVDIQTIGAATTYSAGMRASEFAPDGILGLAFPSHSAFFGQSPLFYTLFNERKLPQPVFSLKLAGSEGELFLGGTNTELYVQSTLVYTPVTSPFLWQLIIDNIQINDKTILKDVPAIIDTGSNFIYGDQARVLALHRAGGGASAGNYYTFPCKPFPTVSFTIGGRSFKIPPNVLNKGRIAVASRDCFTGIVVPMNEDRTDFWSIGTLFLELFYTVFDFNSQSPRIGLAELQGGASSSNPP